MPKWTQERKDEMSKNAMERWAKKKAMEKDGLSNKEKPIPDFSGSEFQADDIPQEIPSDLPLKKPATAPWKEQSNPWKRDILRLNKKRSGFRPRWVDPRNFERNLEDGWTYAKTEHYGGVYEKITGEEKQIDTRIRRRGMVLMEIPEELALQRDAYYAKRADESERSIKERHKVVSKEVGVEPYEPK